MTSALERRVFLGVPFTPLGLDHALDLIVRRRMDEPFAYVATPNAQHTVAAHRNDKRFCEGHTGAWLLLNDSRILRLIARWVFGFDLPLAAGSDLVVALFQHGVPPTTPVVMLGGDAEVEHRMRSRFGLTDIRRFDPPMGFHHDPAEIERCIAFVLHRPARYIFMVVGAPQSEVVAARIVATGRASGIGLCVGSALNFLTGVQPRAPEIWRRSNLEWAYRLMKNPRGHFRRVFIESFPIIWIAFKARLRRQPAHAAE